jgi:hypothetical protein
VAFPLAAEGVDLASLEKSHPRRVFPYRHQRTAMFIRLEDAQALEHVFDRDRAAFQRYPTEQRIEF